MKKISAITLVIIMAFTAVASAATSSTISWTKAKSIALNRAPDKAIVKYLREGTENGKTVYVGKLVKENYLYEIEIDATTGDITEYDRDYIGSRTTPSAIDANISFSEVKAKALNKVSNLRFVYVRLAKDDGNWVYEGDAYKNGYEYSFEIDPYTGEILEWEKDYID